MLVYFFLSSCHYQTYLHFYLPTKHHKSTTASHSKLRCHIFRVLWKLCRKGWREKIWETRCNWFQLGSVKCLDTHIGLLTQRIYFRQNVRKGTRLIVRGESKNRKSGTEHVLRHVFDPHDILSFPQVSTGNELWDILCHIAPLIFRVNPTGASSMPFHSEEPCR